MEYARPSDCDPDVIGPLSVKRLRSRLRSRPLVRVLLTTESENQLRNLYIQIPHCTEQNSSQMPGGGGGGEEVVNSDHFSLSLITCKFLFAS